MSNGAESSLKSRVYSASAWTVGGYGISLAIRFGSNLLLTRLLAPETFGVMAISSVILVGLTLFSDIGLKQSVVQSDRGGSAAFLNTVWIIQIVRGWLLWLIALGASLLLAFCNHLDLIPNKSVYANADVPGVIALLSFSMVISGFQSTKLLQASRNILIARLTKIDVATQIVGLLTILFWVQIDRSIWALVAGSLATSLARTATSYIWLPGLRDQWRWNDEAFREIIKLGKWIFLSSALFFLAGSGDRILLGALVDASTLGTYTVAFLFFSSIDQIFERIIVDVAFPALGEVFRNNRSNLKRAYFRFHIMIACLAYFCAGSLITSGEALVDFLYDQRYHQAGHILQLLAIALMAVPFRIAIQTFLLFGEARLFFHLHTIRMATLWMAIPAGFYFFGFPGALLGIVFSYFSSLPVAIFYAARLKLFDLRTELLALPALPIGLLSGWGFGNVLSSIHLH